MTIIITYNYRQDNNFMYIINLWNAVYFSIGEKDLIGKYEFLLVCI